MIPKLAGRLSPVLLTLNTVRMIKTPGARRKLENKLLLPAVLTVGVELSALRFWLHWEGLKTWPEFHFTDFVSAIYEVFLVKR